jgi:hypothetical protein
MKFFKHFEYGMFHVYAFESDGSQDAFITADLIPITETEADEIRNLPPSEEYRKKMEEGAKALGGRNSARWPPKEFKEAIGHICVNSSHLEVAIRDVIWQVAGLTPEVEMAFTGNTRISDLLQTLQALVATQAPALREKTKEICSKIDMLFKERAKYVHGVWGLGKNNQPTISKQYIERSSAKADEQEVSIDKMYDLAEGFMHAESELLIHILVPLIKK